MSPRPIYTPLSGGDRKFFARQIAQARSSHESWKRQASLLRAEGETMLRAAQEKLKAADQFTCKSWNAIMFCGGPATPSPTIAQAINGGHSRLIAKCNRCACERDVDLRTLNRPADSAIHRIEASLFCESCSTKTNKQRAHILWLREDDPPEPPTIVPPAAEAR